MRVIVALCCSVFLLGTAICAPEEILHAGSRLWPKVATEEQRERLAELIAKEGSSVCIYGKAAPHCKGNILVSIDNEECDAASYVCEAPVLPAVKNYIMEQAYDLLNSEGLPHPLPRTKSQFDNPDMAEMKEALDRLSGYALTHLPSDMEPDNVAHAILEIGKMIQAEAQEKKVAGKVPRGRAHKSRKRVSGSRKPRLQESSSFVSELPDDAEADNVAHAIVDISKKIQEETQEKEVSEATRKRPRNPAPPKPHGPKSVTGRKIPVPGWIKSRLPGSPSKDEVTDEKPEENPEQKATNKRRWGRFGFTKPHEVV